MAFDFEDDEEEIEEEIKIYLIDQLQRLADILKETYFGYMVMQDATFERFKVLYLDDIIPDLLNRINDKYIDHVEGFREINNDTR